MFLSIIKVSFIHKKKANTVVIPCIYLKFRTAKYEPIIVTEWCLHVVGGGGLRESPEINF